MYQVNKIVKVIPYKITLLFNTGETLTIDMETKLKKWSQTPGSIYKPLLKPDYFSEVKLLNKWKTIYWDNGIEFCPDTLYLWATEKKHNTQKN